MGKRIRASFWFGLRIDFWRSWSIFSAMQYAYGHRQRGQDRPYRRIDRYNCNQFPYRYSQYIAYYWQCDRVGQRDCFGRIRQISPGTLHQHRREERRRWQQQRQRRTSDGWRHLWRNSRRYGQTSSSRGTMTMTMTTNTSTMTRLV